MRLADANQMLATNPHADEDCSKILPDGMSYVAARTEVPIWSGHVLHKMHDHAVAQETMAGRRPASSLQNRDVNFGVVPARCVSQLNER